VSLIRPRAYWSSVPAHWNHWTRPGIVADSGVLLGGVRRRQGGCRSGSSPPTAVVVGVLVVGTTAVAAVGSSESSGSSGSSSSIIRPPSSLNTLYFLLLICFMLTLHCSALLCSVSYNMLATSQSKRHSRVETNIINNAKLRANAQNVLALIQASRPKNTFLAYSPKQKEF
jgi:hypothetical protein